MIKIVKYMFGLCDRNTFKVNSLRTRGIYFIFDSTLKEAIWTRQKINTGQLVII